MSLPFTEIAGEKLNREQMAYLEGLFAGLKNRGLTFANIEADPVSHSNGAAASKKNLEALIFEERVKQELHPLDAYPLLLEHATANKAPDKENAFRFKWHGLFFLAPNKEAFMCRLRIPAGQVKSYQLRELARVAQDLTTGHVQITTRANFQLRLIQPKNAPEVLRRVQTAGLLTRGSGADNIRNLTCNPTAGLDPHELVDTLPLCHQLAQIIINERAFYDLPRKFNIAFDGGGLIGTVEDSNDVGVKAVRVVPATSESRNEPTPDPSREGNWPASAAPRLGGAGGGFMDATHDYSTVDSLREKARDESLNPPLRSDDLITNALPPGIYFRLNLGGATGHKTFARDLGVLVRPEELLKVLVAVIRVYISHGNRGDRKKARLKHLLESWSLEKYLEETEKLLGYKLLRVPKEGTVEYRSDGEAGSGDQGPAAPPLRHSIPHSHVGVFPQKQPGLNWIGVAIPVGNITPKQMLRLADLSDNYGSGEVRLTVWQNLIIPNIPDAFVETVKKALVKMGLHWQQSNLRSGLVACTGNSYCKFASSNTKGHALELADYLEKRVALDQPINIHLTGCPNSCAQHYMGDIGLLGAKVKVAGETIEGYHVFVGGGFGANQAVGRQVFQGISVEQLKGTLEKMLKGYLRHRQTGETFQKFTQRHDLNRLQAIFSNDE
jgi:ferredoxin-nitrite reductase